MKDDLRPELQKAVALFYDGSGAPQITAKGVGAEAEALIAAGQAHNIPLCNNPALVDVLAQMEAGERIPEAMYTAVAHIIAFAYRMQLAAAPNTASPFDSPKL